jgi:hypothetical protein
MIEARIGTDDRAVEEYRRSTELPSPSASTSSQPASTSGPRCTGSAVMVSRLRHIGRSSKQTQRTCVRGAAKPRPSPPWGARGKPPARDSGRPRGAGRRAGPRPGAADPACRHHPKPPRNSGHGLCGGGSVR